MHKFLLSLSTALLFVPACANAADLDNFTPSYDWSGLYGGFNAGYAFGGNDRVGLGVTGLGGGPVGDLGLKGWAGGIQAGYNYQMNYFVIGAEADIQGGDINDSDSSTGALGTFDSSDDVNYYATLRARMGLAVSNMLIYGTAGFAWGDVDYSLSGVTLGGDSVDISDSGIYTGYTLGGGAEYAFVDGWSIRAEYLYVNLGAETLSAITSLGNTATTTSSPDFHTIRIGANWKF